MKKFNNILFLMLIPILGVILIQVYWVRNSYDIHEEHLNNTLTRILYIAIDKHLYSNTIKEIRLRDSLNINQDSIKNYSTLTIRKSRKKGEILSSFGITTKPMTKGYAFTKTSCNTECNKHSQDTKLTISPKGRYICSRDSSYIPIDTNNIPVVRNLGGLIFKFMAMIDGYKIDIDSLKKEYVNLLRVESLDTLCELAFYQNNELLKYSNNSKELFVNNNPDLNVPVLPGAKEAVRVIMLQKSKMVLTGMILSIISSLFLVLLVVVGFLYMLRIILKQKKLSQMKNDFINSMTHEFKTPIATVNAAIESILNFGVIENENVTKTYLNISQKELNSLNNMVEKILHISAYEKNKVVFNPEKLNIADILKSLIEVYKLKDSSIIFTVNKLEDNAEAIADRMHIRNLISNLFDNAVKYCKNNPEITVSCYTEGNYVHISVKDNGIGISKEHQKHIFEKFYRAPVDKTHIVKGFGLGLSYVKYVIEEHRGEIDINSTPYKGSEFIIKIPVNYERN